MSHLLNRDINSQFEDWLISPMETLNIEAKGWLDMDDVESKGTIAKALIALENHGGGFLVIGFTEDSTGVLSPGRGRPQSLNQFGTDEVNAIINKYAEPPFHAHVTFQRHPKSGEEFPVIRAPGSSKVPVRSCSETPKGAIKNKVYYVRRPGPASEAPLDGHEWDALIRRCVMNQRGEIVEILRSFIPTPAQGNLAAIVDESEALNQFSSDSFARWAKINKGLEADHPAKIKQGFFSFACRIIGKNKGLNLGEILTVIQGLRRYTGWPIFVALHQPESKPYLKDGALEATLTHIKHPDLAHADFWRVSPDGYFYLLRGYQEDCLETLAENHKVRSPGTGIDLTVPVWRVAEFLLRSEELARSMYEDGFTMLVRCQWEGLEGRELFVFNSRRILFDNHRCEALNVITEGRFTQDAIENLLPEVVKKLTNSLYEHFDFFEPPEKFFDEEITLMRTGRLA